MWLLLLRPNRAQLATQHLGHAGIAHREGCPGPRECSCAPFWGRIRGHKCTLGAASRADARRGDRARDQRDQRDRRAGYGASVGASVGATGTRVEYSPRLPSRTGTSICVPGTSPYWA